ncbi:MAG: polyphosphate polymerase domain-containing protein [Acidobacteriota bacterium]
MTIEAIRYERKYVVDHSIAEVRSLVRIHPAHFVSAYPDRRVNNVYLDTVALGAYQANAAGVGTRTKIRIRWYGPLFGDVATPFLEIKGRLGDVGTKTRHPLPPLSTHRGIDARSLEGAVRNLPLGPDEASLCAGTRPVLLTTYLREYWVTYDGRFRLTIDSEIGYGGASLRDARALLLDRHLVVELKYERDDALSAEVVASRFPLRLSRSSKFARGLERLLPLGS